MTVLTTTIAFCVIGYALNDGSPSMPAALGGLAAGVFTAWATAWVKTRRDHHSRHRRPAPSNTDRVPGTEQEPGGSPVRGEHGST